jgi:hypothetical protein
MSKKKNKKKKEEKKAKKDADSKSGVIDQRAKEAMSIRPPEENPFFMDNEKKIERWRPAWRTDWTTLKENNNRANRR